MSDAVLLLVPADRFHVPTADARERAVALLRQFAPSADEVRATVRDEPAFIDCGGNWSGVRCPACGADAERWFVEAVESAYERSRFHDLAAVTRCCGAALEIDRLDFGRPVAFGRFVLSARNPGLAHGGLSDGQRAAMESATGSALVAVQARY